MNAWNVAWRVLGRGLLLASLALAAPALLGLGPTQPRPPEHAPEKLLPSAGRLLIATEQIRGSIFFESVVFLVDYGPGGALGVIVNRPTDVALGDLVVGAASGAGTVHLGGPVDTTSMLFLLRAPSPPEEAQHVTGDVFVSGSERILREVIQVPDAEERLRVYVGYAGWAAGQLDREIGRGDWIVAPATTAPIFHDDPEQLWKNLFREHQRLMVSAPAPPRLAVSRR